MRPCTAAVPWTRLARTVVAAVGLVSLAGCATLRATIDGYGSGPQGISRPQHRLREALSHENFVAALAWREHDPLLQSLTSATAAYYAGQFARAGAVLDSAALVADDRITTSLSREGLALLTNDLARPYQPRRTERLFMPYYAMLSYARLEAWEDAAVEARRVLALLDQYAGDRVAEERTVHGSLAQLAGAMLERAGERSEAAAAYHVAAALDSAFVTPSAAPPSGRGEVLIVVERGFVAHRVSETIELFVAERRGDYVALRRRSDAHAGASGTSLISMPWGDRDSSGDHEGRQITIAFPVVRHSSMRPGGSLAVTVDDIVANGTQVSAPLDDATAADANRELVALAAHAAARALAKEAVTRAIANKKGELAGSIASVGAFLLERADVRSWHLLPREITLLRLRVPAGTHALRLVVGEGTSARGVELGPVVVRDGVLSVVPVRVWRDESPSGPTRPVVASLAAAPDSVAAIRSSP